ncbi:tetratricopeptide repeat protein [Streptomyces sp. NPDC059080]|uniref:tetratricopeptide repeat protein n=1 Tax=Streptomyces sp. NPDC059080 TaxID=3346718 RepID=UPI0036B43C7A
MNDRRTREPADVRNTVAGDAVVSGPIIQAGRIEQLAVAAAVPFWVPRQVPPPHQGFVNRSSELAQLRRAAAVRENDAGRPVEPAPVIVVTGLGGVGKTQLVSQWVARDLSEHCPGPQLYVDLADLRRDGGVHVADVLGGFLHALGVPHDLIPAGLGPRTVLFRSATAGGRVLVVIDNAQHAAEVRPLVPASGLAVVTSRTRMPGLQMDGAAHVVVDPLDEAAGIQLIRGWRIAASESAAAELVRRCGGLPLALRAAGEWLAGRPHLQVGDAVRRLGTTGPQGARPAGAGQEPPTGPGGDDGASAAGDLTRTVGRVFDSVLTELSEDTRRVYQLLGCLPGTTFVRAVVTATGTHGVDDALGSLLTSHLVVPADPDGDAAGPRRFRMHDLARSHARGLAQELPAEEARAVRRAVTDFYVAAAAHADRVASPGRFRIQEAPGRTPEELADGVPLFTGKAEALDWLDAERGNLLAVMRMAEQERWHDAVWRLCESLWPLYHDRKHHADSIEAHHLGIEAAQWEQRPGVEVRMRNQLARAQYQLGEYEEAERELARALPLADAVDDSRVRGVILESQGLVALARGRWEDALGLFREALATNADDPHGTVVQRYNIAQAHLAGERWKQALDVLVRAWETAVATDDALMLPGLALVRSRAHEGLGRLDRAVDDAVFAAETALKAGRTAKLNGALERLAVLAERTGDTRLRTACRDQLARLHRRADVRPPTG